MRADDLARRIPSAKRRGERWDALCPAHEDTRPSLTFRDDPERGRVGLLCRSGCAPDAIAAALELSLADLHHDDTGRRENPAPRPRVVAQHEYRDERGELLYVVERLEPKRFRQKRPDGRGGWFYNLDGARRVLFGLRDLAGAPLVLIPEGEKDVLALRALGLVATCNPMGAGKWTTDYARQLVAAGVRDVVILPDHDAAGEAHAHSVARSCAGAGLGVKLIGLPGLAPKEDASDWLVAGHGKAELLALVAAAPAWAPVPAPAPSSPWDKARPVADFVNAPDGTVAWHLEPVLAPGSITEMFSPRGIGKTHVAYAWAIVLERAEKRVLLLDRDNSTREVRRRLRAWGGATTDPTRFKFLGRDDVPPLTDTQSWAQFPYAAYDVVILDSLDASTEGVGEQDSARPSRALAPILDIAHRAGGPAILILGNTIKSAAHSRGSGVVEDRADIAYEVRDCTGFTPSGAKPWHEELPPAGAEAWAARSTRRKRRDAYRLAFVPSKFRVGEEPAPFVLEIRLPDAAPWSLHDVTGALEGEGEAARTATEQARADLLRAAADALEAEIQARAAGGAAPLVLEGAVALLGEHDIRRRHARALIAEGTGRRWRVELLLGRKGRPRALLPMVDRIADGGIETPGGNNNALAESPVETGSGERRISADRMNSGRQKYPPTQPRPQSGDSHDGIIISEGLFTAPPNSDADENLPLFPAAPERPATPPEAAGSTPADGDDEPVDLVLPPRRSVRL